MSGPLTGIRVVELAGIGPGPFCCMMLADMGADVIRVDRAAPADLGTPQDPKYQLLNRSRRSIAVNLKSTEGVEVVKRLVAKSDVLVEGYRPGVTERMGLGPKDCWQENSALVYGRMTGWGQDGPLAKSVGHDISYIAITGALDAIGERGGPPVPPLNLVGDFGGGALYLAFGVLCAVIEARNSGKGQIVDAAIVDGTMHMMTSIFGSIARDAWLPERGSNMLAGGAHFYGVYETRDGRHVSIGAIEKRFYGALLEKIGVDPECLPPQHDSSHWAELKTRFEEIFRTKTLDEWDAILRGTDACYAPVLTLAEAGQHPHIAARKIMTEVAGITQPEPAPRLSRTAGRISGPPPTPGLNSVEILRDLGYSGEECQSFLDKGAVSKS